MLALIDNPHGSLFELSGHALANLPPYVETDRSTTSTFPLAAALLQQLGQVYDPDYIAVAQLERALRGIADAGMPMEEARLRLYATHVMAIAEYEMQHMPQDCAASYVEYAVLGRALYEPLLAAMRRLAHQDFAARRLAVEESPTLVRTSPVSKIRDELG